jgi:hypothetical protein
MPHVNRVALGTNILVSIGAMIINSPFRRALAAALPLAALIAQSFAEDKPDSLKFDTVFVVSQTVSKNEEREFGLLHGGVLLKDGRPEACFDLVVDKGESDVGGRANCRFLIQSSDRLDAADTSGYGGRIELPIQTGNGTRRN